MALFNLHHLYISLLLPRATPDIASDRAALVALRATVGGRVLFWNLSSPTPCSWPGVVCSPDKSSVVELHLPATGLSGRLPPKTISILTNLHTLSLRYNSLSGPLTPDIFSSPNSLRNLYLQHNFLTAGLPDSLFHAKSLVRLNLAHNNFSGQISPSFNKLTRLGTLYLQHNHFSGSILDLKLPALIQFDVSNNNLTESYEARVSESSLVQLGCSATPNQGYQVPEVTGPKNVSQKADVYSFGIFLLELVTGEAPGIDEDGFDLAGWVQSKLKQDWRTKVLDMELVNVFG